MKPVTFLLVFALLLAACAGPAPASTDVYRLPATLPAQTGAAPASPSAPPSAPPTAPPSAPPPAAPLPPASPSSKSLAGCSPAPLETGLLISTWEPERRGYRIQPVDAQTGLPLCGRAALLTGLVVWHSRSPDGARLALVDREELDPESRVRIVDLRTWQAQTYTAPFAGFITRLAFSPSGAQLAMAYSLEMNRGPDVLYTDELAVLDLKTGAVTAQTSLDIAVRVLAFTQDGKSLAVFGAPDGSKAEGKPPARALLLRLAGLAATWDQPLPDLQVGVTQYAMAEDQMPMMEFSEPGLAFSPGAQALYIVRADQDRLTTVDFTRRLVASQEIRPSLSWLERLIYATAGVAHAKGGNGTTKQAVLSPDGRSLYVTGWTETASRAANGDWQFDLQPLGLQVIDLASASETKRLEINAQSLALSADGRYAFLGVLSGDLAWAQVVSTESWETIRSLTGADLIPAQRLDGAPVLVSQRGSPGSLRIALLDPASFEETAAWDLPINEMGDNPVW